MEKTYLIEFFGEKERNEMEALELNTLDSAITWIKEAMKSDEKYFNCEINCNIYIEDDFHAIVFIYANNDIDEIIESNLSIISKIIKKIERINQ